MKKIAAILCMATFAFTMSCTKPYTNNTGSDLPPLPTPESLTVPSSFSSKVLIEEFSATWCGYCPSMPLTLAPFEEDNPDRVYVITHHLSDEFSSAQDDSVASLFNITGIPDVVVNRIPGSYISQINASLQQVNNVGIGINSVIDSRQRAAISVNVGFAADVTTPVSLTVFLIEDGIVMPQVSYYNDDETSAFFELGDPIENYVHKAVVRQVLTSTVLGEIIPDEVTKAGKYFTRSFIVDVSQYNTKNVSIVAFVGKQGSNANNSGIVNAQVTRIGTSRGWE